MKFDYKKLFKENLIPLKPQNEFKVIERIKIDAVQYDYCGQIDKTTQKPDGLGLAIRGDGGRMIEGVFNQGEIEPIYQYIYLSNT